MRVDVLTAAKSTALLTRAAVKARLGIADATTTWDTTLDALIAGVSAAAVRLIVGIGPAVAARAIVAQQYRVLQPGSERKKLLLPLRPIDPSTVTVTLDGTALVVADDYAIDSAAEGILYRSSGWPFCDTGDAGPNSIQVDLWAGYVPPAVAAAWTNRSVAVGDWVLPSNPAASPLRFRCTAAGAMGATEPTWSSYAAGASVTAGAATLVAHALPDAPPDLLEGAHFAVQTWFRSQDSPILRGIAADQMGPHTITYAKPADFFVEGLPLPTRSLWGALAA